MRKNIRKVHKITYKNNPGRQKTGPGYPPQRSKTFTHPHRKPPTPKNRYGEKRKGGKIEVDESTGNKKHRNPYPENIKNGWAKTKTVKTEIGAKRKHGN
jgi:hypothetical protein